jgi:hypothetical protein
MGAAPSGKERRAYRSLIGVTITSGFHVHPLIAKQGISQAQAELICPTGKTEYQAGLNDLNRCKRIAVRVALEPPSEHPLSLVKHGGIGRQPWGR